MMPVSPRLLIEKLRKPRTLDYFLRLNHGRREHVRDDDEDGFYEVHIDTVGGVWSLLRSWIRHHRGISQKYLSHYISFFEFIHNAGKRGKTVLHSLIETLVSRPQNAY